MTATVKSIDAAPKSSLEARTEDDTEAASDADVINATPDLTDDDTPSGCTCSPEAIEHSLAARDPLLGAGWLTPAEATAVLEAFRERVVRPATNEWEPHRSILRPAMIETFVQQRVSDPADWYTRIPQYLRSSTAAAEKVRFLDQICDIVARIRMNEQKHRPDLSPRPGTLPGLRSKPPPAATGPYRIANPADVACPNRERFYDAVYQPTLRTMVAHVLAIEAPIYEDLLVDRIARAHGQQRSGLQIRRCVLAALPVETVGLEEGDGRKVVWADAASAGAVVPFRPDADGVRGQGDIPLCELAAIAVPLVRLSMDEEAILKQMANAVQVGRFTEAARLRMQSALAIARNAEAKEIPSRSRLFKVDTHSRSVTSYKPASYAHSTSSTAGRSASTRPTSGSWASGEAVC